MEVKVGGYMHASLKLKTVVLFYVIMFIEKRVGSCYSSFGPEREYSSLCCRIVQPIYMDWAIYPSEMLAALNPQNQKKSFH